MGKNERWCYCAAGSLSTCNKFAWWVSSRYLQKVSPHIFFPNVDASLLFGVARTRVSISPSDTPPRQSSPKLGPPVGIFQPFGIAPVCTSASTERLSKRGFPFLIFSLDSTHKEDFHSNSLWRASKIHLAVHNASLLRCGFSSAVTPSQLAISYSCERKHFYNLFFCFWLIFLSLDQQIAR